MYISQRDKILSLLLSIEEALDYLISNINPVLITDCKDAVTGIVNYLDNINELEELNDLLILQDMIVSVDEQNEIDVNFIYNIKNLLLKCIKIISQRICRYKAVFLPYKADMWTSLESIWIAAYEDPYCDAFVVPIPYADIGKGLENIIWHYELDRYPEYVPTISFENYDFESEKPEMIFIHNPYDNTNNLTTVPPQYYSWELKKHTKCLVYSPYYTNGSYKYGEHDFQYVSSAIHNADKVVVQSKFTRNIFVNNYHVNQDKLLVTGSPKIDAIINMKSVKAPTEWEKKLKNKKVFLLNTHLSYFTQGYSLAEKYGYNFAIRNHEIILDTFLNKNDLGLIWRPHPLMRTMVKDRSPESLEFIDYFTNELNNSNNCVVDTLSDYRTAFEYSDAMISTYSSLINEYMVTGKPILIFRAKPSIEVCNQSPIDISTCYFCSDGESSISFGEFAEMVINKEDPKRAIRMSMLNERAFANLDGSAGRKAFEQVCFEIKNNI